MTDGRPTYDLAGRGRRGAALVLLVLLPFGLASLAVAGLTGETKADGATKAAVTPLADLTPEARTVVYPKGPDKMEPLAKGDPLAFLATALAWYESKVVDYTCTFQKQELVKDKLLPTETMLMKFREQPFSVYLEWIENPKRGREAIYVEGKYDNKLVVHPDGLLGLLFRKVSLEPTDKLAVKESRRPITFAGMANVLRLAIPESEKAQAAGDLQLEYLGLTTHDGRPAYLFKRTLPKKEEYPAFQLYLTIDQQFLLPVRAESYDWAGRLLLDYKYTNLTVNPHLPDEAWNPDNPDYEYRAF